METGDSIARDGSEAKSQLEDFGIPGYRRVLVVPDADFEAIEVNDFAEQVDADISGEFYVATPTGVSDLL